MTTAVAPLLYESHSHTPLCKHARGEPEEYAAVAEARGLKGIIFTCHCPLPDGISHGFRGLGRLRVGDGFFRDRRAHV